ncbi:hypothetical protein G7Z17_g4474 [Cylindrodendrum hubeiense]|uniref:Uncharacterized protein n=1 Tax=Cylindrodendrum hubeiense TaxID=595255 RepID=A0A9P5LCM1_9HYPO|nr:hypothetical protein G7Z17_g4474 [Cylindrodendrum hubeiense]
MAELALGILGVVPMALKSYQVLASKLKTFRHCSSIVQRMYKMLRVQRRVFENECQLLLRGCLYDDSTAQLMIADPDHRDWGKRSWDDNLRASLKENYDDCVELVQSILEIIRQLESDLDCFETVKTEQKKDERLKDTWKRVSNGLKMTFNKTEYETGLDDLRTTNSDLQNLREQIYQLQKPCHIDDKAEENYRHQFFSPSKSFCQGIHSSTIELGNSIPMDIILLESSSDAFSTVDKLKMARALVSAVLKFHATPWLGEIWRLQDLSFLHQGGQDLTLALPTLHVGVEFGQKSVRRIGLDSNVEDVQMASSSSNLWEMNEDELLYCGIDNVALHCLGVALLQIDRLKKFEPEDVLGVRRVGRVGSTLGPRYQEITQKCLRCDFGYGTDLGKTQLQKAVYESVIGALESMISTLSIDDDL